MEFVDEVDDRVELEDVVEADCSEDWQLVSDSPSIAMTPMTVRSRLSRLNLGPLVPEPYSQPLSSNQLADVRDGARRHAWNVPMVTTHSSPCHHEARVR